MPDLMKLTGKWVSASTRYIMNPTLISKGRRRLWKGWKKVSFKKEDGSVWADLTAEGLDHKLLLRGDGTSVYMTQDIGTAKLRFADYPIDKMIYVVGNEQNYHFQVLSILLDKLGFEWGKSLVHFSYGMVELPEGKMKSREGTVVDADDLMEEMIATAKETSQELGKLDGLTQEEADDIARIVGLGALKYFILKVDARKNMTFNPKESIDFNGNTGPFIQYTYARIQSVLRKAAESGIVIPEQIPVGIELDMRILKNSDCLVYRLSELPVLCEEQYKKMTLSQQEDTYGNLLDTLPPIHEFSLGLIHYLADGMPCKKCFSYYIAIIPVHKWLLFYIRP